MATVLFISDLHLSASRPHINKLFSQFLNLEARQAETLYILGDLFDYWAGDDDLEDPFNRSVASSLRGLADSGVGIFFMHGNRDFLLGDWFCRAAAATLLSDPAVAQINGNKTLLMHGDTLCTDDVEYQRFRREVRDPNWQRKFLARPLAERKAVAEDLRQKSETEKQHKSRDIMDVAPATVEATLRDYNYPRLIHGHTHRPALHVHEVDGRQCERWVLPDWYEVGGYLRCDEQGMRLITLSA